MSFLIYGAYGYTGKLIAREAVDRGMKPILAGRNPDKLVALADTLSLEYVAFDLADTNVLDEVLAKVSVVLHCAGPFAHTADLMVEACLRTGTHYLDITGEIAVFEAMAARDLNAHKAGLMIMPGVGFDVVPTDSMAAHLKRRLPSATHLELGFESISGLSQGTATTAVENISGGGAIRRAGQVVSVPAFWKTRDIDYGRGSVQCVSIPWGDVSTAYYTTGIPNIIVYSALPARTAQLVKLSRYVGWLLASAPVQSFLKAQIRKQPAGPSDAERARCWTTVWGEVRDAEGQVATARLAGPESYTLTVLTALGIVENVLAGNAPVGFQTPAKAYGPDWILKIDGVKREDL